MVAFIAILALLACTQHHICEGTPNNRKDVQGWGRTKEWKQGTIPVIKVTQTETLIPVPDTVEELDEPSVYVLGEDEAPPSFVKCIPVGPTTIKLEVEDMDLNLIEPPETQEMNPNTKISSVQGLNVIADMRPEREYEEVENDWNPLWLLGLKRGLNGLSVRRSIRPIQTLRGLELLRKISALYALREVGYMSPKLSSPSYRRAGYGGDPIVTALYNLKRSKETGSTNGLSDKLASVPSYDQFQTIIPVNPTWFTNVVGRGPSRRFFSGSNGESYVDSSDLGFGTRTGRNVYRSYGINNGVQNRELGNFRSFSGIPLFGESAQQPFVSAKVVKGYTSSRATSPSLELYV